jgi:hypothetical protein
MVPGCTKVHLHFQPMWTAPQREPACPCRAHTWHCIRQDVTEQPRHLILLLQLFQACVQLLQYNGSCALVPVNPAQHFPLCAGSTRACNSAGQQASPTQPLHQESREAAAQVLLRPSPNVLPQCSKQKAVHAVSAESLRVVQQHLGGAVQPESSPQGLLGGRLLLLRISGALLQVLIHLVWKTYEGRVPRVCVCGIRIARPAAHVAVKSVLQVSLLTLAVRFRRHNGDVLERTQQTTANSPL